MNLAGWLLEQFRDPTPPCPICKGPLVRFRRGSAFCCRCAVAVQWQPGMVGVAYLERPSPPAPERPPAQPAPEADEGPDRTQRSEDGPPKRRPRWMDDYVAVPDPLDTARCFNCGCRVHREGATWLHTDDRKVIC